MTRDRIIGDKSGMIAAVEIPAATPPADTPRTPRRRPTVETRRNARRDFVQGKGSKRAIAERYRVNVDTIKEWAKQEDWDTLRRDFDLQELDKLRVTPLPPAPPPPPVTPQAARVASVEQEMERLEKAMAAAHDTDGTCNAAVLRDLSAAHSRLFEVWCVLTGTQKPGVRKSRGSRSLAPVAEPQVAPVPQVPDNQPSLI